MAGTRSSLRRMVPRVRRDTTVYGAQWLLPANVLTGPVFGAAHPGCQEIAEEFRAQEIDGQALLLLKEDHLMSAMNIKLGPALKIYARISMLKDS